MVFSIHPRCPVFKAQVEAAKAKAEELGVKLVAIDAQDDMVKQLET